MNFNKISQQSESDRNFDLLLQPELWPEGNKEQMLMAELLEMHLALQAHRNDIDPTVMINKQNPNIRQMLIMLAATLLAVLPSVYVLTRTQIIKEQAKHRANIQEVASKRAQERLWADFFKQSLELLKDFKENPPICKENKEDRTQERQQALVLLQASHQLASQGAPVPEAEIIRNQLHTWLTELTIEDSCMTAQRVQELRQMAFSAKLEDGVGRLGLLLNRDLNQ